MRLLGLAAPMARGSARLVLRRPVVSVGVTAFALLAGGLSANALYGQPGRHPHPLMATREGMASAASTQPIPLVVDVQTELAALGLYGGPADGRPGILTEAAVRAFQKAAGMSVDGVVSQDLLAAIRARVPASGSERARNVASLAQRMGTVEETGSVTPALPTRRAAPDPMAKIVHLDEKELVRRIQAGLTQAQVAELHADGIVGEQTRAAIRAFEALEGLQVTGTPDRRILARLMEIGATE